MNCSQLLASSNIYVAKLADIVYLEALPLGGSYITQSWQGDC
jgi:hypothetical protein